MKQKNESKQINSKSQLEFQPELQSELQPEFQSESQQELEQNTKTESQSEISFAFLQTIPVMLGYICLGIAFGLMLQDAGYHFLWALLCSICIYAGSMQFVLVTLLTGGVSLVYAAVMTFFINGRQIFYGLSLLDQFKQMGKYYPYMIFSLTDETYSLLCSVKIPKQLNQKRTRFLMALFDHLYWITGSVVGAVAGQLIQFDTTGVDFSMTALFIVIVINQWKESKSHISAIAGFVVGIMFLVLLGADHFLVPALAVVSLFLILIKGKKDYDTLENV